MVWREEDHSLTALSKDHEDCQVFSAEYLIDEPGMAIVVADGRRNIKVRVTRSTPEYVCTRAWAFPPRQQHESTPQDPEQFSTKPPKHCRSVQTKCLV